VGVARVVAGVARGVVALAKVREHERAHAALVPQVQLGGLGDRVGALKGQNQADGRGGGVGVPGRGVVGQRGGRREDAHVAAGFEAAVVGQLARGLGVGHVLGGPVAHGPPGGACGVYPRLGPGQQGGQARAKTCGPQLGQAGGAGVAAVGSARAAGGWSRYIRS